MISLVVVATALAAILFDPAHAQDDFYDATISAEWMNATLYCSNTTTPLPINDTDPVSWMLPNLTVLYVSSHKYLIENNNWTMVVINATAADLGQYHCLIPVNGTSDYYLVRLGLNAGGPYFEDLWDKYNMNTVIGVSVAGGFAVLCVLLYLIDRFRYREPEDEHHSKTEVTANGRNEYIDVVELGPFKGTFAERENGLKMRDLGKDNPGADAICEDEEEEEIGTKL